MRIVDYTVVHIAVHTDSASVVQLQLVVENTGSVGPLVVVVKSAADHEDFPEAP